jgi:hypothetical protein
MIVPSQDPAVSGVAISGQCSFRVIDVLALHSVFVGFAPAGVDRPARPLKRVLKRLMVTSPLGGVGKL